MSVKARRRTSSGKRARGIRHGGRGWLIGAGVVGAIGLLVVLSSTLSGPAAVGEDRLASGSSGVPDVPVIVYQGEELVGTSNVSLGSLGNGKPVVLNYWASNCAPCTAEMPEFQKVWEKYQDRVLFFGLDVGRFSGFGSPERSKQELKELGITYPAGTIPDIEAAYRLQVRGLPSTVFIAADGRVQRTWVGILNESKLTEIVESLLRAS